MSPGIPSTPEPLPFVNYFILLFITSKYESNARESIASLRETLLIEFIFAFVSRLNASLNCSAQRFNISLESVRRIPSVERTMEDPSLLGPLQILIKKHSYHVCLLILAKLQTFVLTTVASFFGV